MSILFLLISWVDRVTNKHHDYFLNYSSFCVCVYVCVCVCVENFKVIKSYIWNSHPGGYCSYFNDAAFAHKFYYSRMDLSLLENHTINWPYKSSSVQSTAFQTGFQACVI